jgi:hypothetical protein
MNARSSRRPSREVARGSQPLLPLAIALAGALLVLAVLTLSAMGDGGTAASDGALLAPFRWAPNPGA